MAGEHLEKWTRRQKAFAIFSTVLLISIVLTVSVFLLSPESEVSPQFPIIRNLSFSELPPLNTTTNLTYTISLVPVFFEQYGACHMGNISVEPVLPAGLSLVEGNKTIRKTNLVLGEDPVSFAWEVKPVKVGNWTIRVYINSTDPDSTPYFLNNKKYSIGCLPIIDTISLGVSEGGMEIIEKSA